MKLVVIESPYAASAGPSQLTLTVEENVEYARRCVRDSLSQGEAPIASHLLYTQPGILRDEVKEERQWGMDAGHAWIAKADFVAVYTDKGVSRGMLWGINTAKKHSIPVVYRTLALED